MDYISRNQGRIITGTETLVSWAQRTVPRNRSLYLVLWSVMFLSVTALLAATKLLWADELTTSYLSELSSVRTIWGALLEGADAHPPLSFLLVHLSYRAFGVSHLSSRLPFILAFWVMCLCIFFFVEKRCGSLYGFAAMSLPLVSGVYAYSYECRPYALVLAASAAAMWAWQRACEKPSLWPKLALCLSLMIAISSHFFAVFISIPLIAGQSVRDLRSRKVDYGMWFAIVGGVLPVALFLPIAQAINKLYFQTAFWSRPSFTSGGETYRLMLELAEAPMLLIVLLWAALRISSNSRIYAANAVPIHERVAVAVLALFPVYAVAASFVTGAYNERYGLPTIVGLVFGLVFLSFSRAMGNQLFAVVACCVLIGSFVSKQTRLIEHQRTENRNLPFGPARPFDTQSWVISAARSSLPLVLADSVFFTQVQEYEPKALSGRIHY